MRGCGSLNYTGEAVRGLEHEVRFVTQVRLREVWNMKSGLLHR